MTPYFYDDGEWLKAKAVLDSWKGTPFRPFWARKGRGADCGLFVGAALVDMGVLERIDHQFYPEDWFLHSKLELVKDMFAQNIATNMSAGFCIHELPPTTELMRGDVVVFSTVPATRITNHAGIMTDPPNHFMHCTRTIGVSGMNWGRLWGQMLTAVYRVMV